MQPPTPADAPIEREADARRVSEAAAREAAQDLLRLGFDEARAEAADIVARRGRTRWRLVNQVTYESGIRGRLLDRFAASVADNILSRPPATAPAR